MMKFRNHAGQLLVVALIAVVSLSLVPSSSVSASPSSSASEKLISRDDSDVNTIRSYFFCSSAACKKNDAIASTNAAAAMNELDGDVTKLNLMSSVGQRPFLTKLANDVQALQDVYSNYATQTSTVQVAKNTGIIYYETANIYSDLYLLSSTIRKFKPSFATWSFGAVAVLYTMQVDTQVIDAKSSSAATDIATNLDLEQDARALKADANGPNKVFNSLLVTFANTQSDVSRDENALLEKKKLLVSNSVLNGDVKKLESDFNAIVKLQKSLAK